MIVVTRKKVMPYRVGSEQEPKQEKGEVFSG